MANVTNPAGLPLAGVGVEELRRNWGWILAIGIGLIVLGAIALGAPLLMTAGVMLVFGWLLLICGILQIIHSVRSRRWSGFLLHVLVGLLYAVVGFLILTRPQVAIVGAETLTLLLAAFFIVTGLFRIVGSLELRFHNWGWSVASGVINVVLGLLIWVEWPKSSLFVIGLFVAIDMLFFGVTLVMLALTVKNLPAQTT